MKTSQFPLNTIKETPADAEVISHQLMLRAGLIRRVASGIYTWLPLGLKVIQNVKTIVREEMDRAGALEMFMPAIQPSHLWEESGRWQQYGPELLRLTDRHDREFCVGPTHEEIITDFARNEIRSYKQLPVNYYQIQTKFRDEIRPRFGVMRSREFIMKDAYSFHTDAESLQQSYNDMHDAYHRIFTRLGLEYRAVMADGGSIGGDTSQEFHVLADSGEDDIAYVENGNFAANVEMAPTFAPTTDRSNPQLTMERLHTPELKTIADLAEFLKVAESETIKTLFVEAEAEGELVCLCLRGDHQLNAIKAEKLPQIKAPLTMASEEAVKAITGSGFGSLGPVGISIPVIADFAIQNCIDMTVGANEKDYHLTGVNWGRDCPEPMFADIRNVIEGDPAPDNQGTIKIARGIEVGHIFQLGDKYSTSMDCTVLDENGKSCHLQMGCYGIGITRVIASAIEQNFDKHGIIWPDAMAPFQIAICPMNGFKSMRLMEYANELYQALTEIGFKVLLDDRPIRPGPMLSDMELIGIPHRITLGERGLDKQEVEYRHRRASENEIVPQDQILTFIKQRITTPTQ